MTNTQRCPQKKAGTQLTETRKLTQNTIYLYKIGESATHTI